MPDKIIDGGPITIVTEAAAQRSERVRSIQTKNDLVLFLRDEATRLKEHYRIREDITPQTLNKRLQIWEGLAQAIENDSTHGDKAADYLDVEYTIKFQPPYPSPPKNFIGISAGYQMNITKSMLQADNTAPLKLDLTK